MRNLILLIALSSVGFVQSQQTDSPKLVVGIVVDQMCYEYLYRYSDKFSEGGLKELMSKGVNFL